MSLSQSLRAGLLANPLQLAYKQASGRVRLLTLDGEAQVCPPVQSRGLIARATLGPTA
jgi:hypothetical protein